MATNLRAKFGYMRSFSTAAFQNGLQYHHSNSKIFNGNFSNILCKYYEDQSSDSRDYEDTEWDGIHSHIPPNISATTGWTNLHQISALIDICMGIIKLKKSFTVTQGTLLWWPINFGALCRRQNWPPSLFALAFQNGMQYCLVITCINSIININASTLCKNLVNIGPVTLS